MTGLLLQPSKYQGKVTSPPFFSICPFSQWRIFSTLLSNSNSIWDENRVCIGTYKEERVINRIIGQNTNTLPQDILIVSRICCYHTESCFCLVTSHSQFHGLVLGVNRKSHFLIYFRGLQRQQFRNRVWFDTQENTKKGRMYLEKLKTNLLILF